MKYKPDKLSRFLTNLSLVIFACFGALFLLFVLKYRLEYVGFSVTSTIFQYGIGIIAVIAVLWLASTLFRKNEEKNDE